MRTQLLQIRLSNEEKGLCQRKADLIGKSMSEWARLQLGLDQPARANKSRAVEEKKPEGNPYPNAIVPGGVIGGAAIKLSDLDDDDEVKQITKKDAAGMLWARADE